MMRVATYNVRVDTDYDQDWQWRFRQDKVCSLIAFHDWDLVAIQEVRPNQVRDLTQLDAYLVLAQERDGDGTGEGLALLIKKAKYHISDHGAFWLSETPEQPSIHPDAAYRRVCVWAIVQERATAKASLVVDVHLDNESEVARYSGMKVVLRQLAQQIAAYPTIILGDFNAEPEERVHGLLAENFTNAKALADIPHYGPVGTFQNFQYSLPWSQLEKIDYIYTKGYEIKATGVLTDSFDNKYASDHFPLEARLVN